MVRTREYLRAQFEDADAMDIIVRVYSNLEGMANFLVKLDKVRNLGQLRAFSTGFCGRISSFDWVDTGVGKEGGAGRKVRGKSYSSSSNHVAANVQIRKFGLLHIKLPPTARPRCMLTSRPSYNNVFHSSTR
jgi:hypothetical protein